MSRQTQAIIHANAIEHNFSQLQALAPDSQSIAVIKADAYGHGAVNVARLLRGKAHRFAVAIMEEALTLREAGIREPIVVLEGPHQAKECALAAQHACILVVHNQQQLGWIAACQTNQRPDVWIKVDTGMHRLGFAPEEVPSLYNDYASLWTDETTLATHLACADDTDNTFTQQQLARFAALQQQVSLPVSIANSPATIAWPQSRGNWNRLGLALYGAQPLASPAADGPQLMAAMTLRASVMALHKVKKGESVGYGQTWVAQQDSVVATVGIGYADGYPRHCPNGTPVVINGQRAKLAGRVSMDMITIDVTDIADVKIGDRVELWGNQVSIDEIAACAGTIAYELMTRVSPRVPRIVKHV